MGQQSISIDQPTTAPVPTYGLMNPSYKGVYVFSIGDVPGVVAAQNHLSLFNPSGNTKTFIFGGVFISSFSVAAITLTANSMRGFRITTASAGTLQTNSTAVTEFQSTMPTSSAEVQTGNPTVTLGPAVFSSPLQVGNGVSSAVHSILAPPGSGAFTFAPGEGLVLQTATGDVDSRWNISFVWAEV